MIFVSNGGGKYKWAQHVPWNGLNFADVIFPCFIFIMGASIPFTTKKQTQSRLSQIDIFIQNTCRSLNLFHFGYHINLQMSEYNFNSVRVFGVLQRTAITYFIASFIYTYYRLPKLDNVQLAYCRRIKHTFLDIWKIIRLWIVIGALIMINLFITLYARYLDCPR